MGTRILWFVVAVLVVVGGVYYYRHYTQQKTLDSGQVHWVSGQPSPEEAARFDRENHGETADGQSEHKNESARQTAADIARNPQGAPQAAPQDGNVAAVQNVRQDTLGQQVRADEHKMAEHFDANRTNVDAGRTDAPMYDSQARNAQERNAFRWVWGLTSGTGRAI